MRKEYDLSKLKSRKNPYAKYLKKQISIKINNETIDYFQNLATETGIPYQTLINMYLTDCAIKHKKVEMLWK